MKDGDYCLTDKPNPWYQMVVSRKLDSLIWKFPYTEENCKEIEELLQKFQVFIDFYKCRLEMCQFPSGAIDWTSVKWYNHRIGECRTSLDYYTGLYKEKKEIKKDFYYEKHGT